MRSANGREMASGAKSTFGRTSWAKHSMSRAGSSVSSPAIFLQFGDRIAPGGYAWLFPKGVGIANVGLGIVALRADGRNAREYLDAWIARRYPGSATVGADRKSVV